MKTFICIIYFFFIFLNSFSQTTLFNETFHFELIDSLDRDEVPEHIAKLHNGFFLLPVNTFTNNSGVIGFKFIIYSINSLGQTVAVKEYKDIDTLYNLSYTSIKPTIDSNFIISGSAYNQQTNNSGVLIMKINYSGDTLWTKKTFTGQISTATDVIEIIDKNIITVGEVQGLAGMGQPTKVLIMKMDSLGNEIWKYQYGGSGFNGASSVISTQDSCVLVLTYHQPQGSQNRDIVLFKVDSVGGVVWTKTYATPNIEGGTKIIKTLDGNYLIVGERLIGTDPQGLLIKINTAGTIIWEKTYGGVETEGFESVVESANGKLFVVGLYSTSAINNGLIISLDSNGDELWSKQYVKTNNDRFTNIETTIDNGLIAMGTSSIHYNTPPYQTHQDTWLVKTDSLGCYVAGCNTVGLSTTKPMPIGSLTIQPTIFSTEAIVTYTVPNNEETLYLDIYNITGTLVKTYTLPANTTNYKLNAQELNQGVKLAVLRTNTTHISTQKIVIIN